MLSAAFGTKITEWKIESVKYHALYCKLRSNKGDNMQNKLAKAHFKRKGISLYLKILTKNRRIIY